jgi:antitoxin CptB
MGGGDERVRRLKWLCRRGMKELDLLLERFIETEHAALREGAWPEFEELLGVEDDLLWDWMQNPRQAQAAPYRRLLEQIRDDSA